MPFTELQVFPDSDGTIPFQVWLDDLETREPDAYAKCLALLQLLESQGYELRRPHADSLRDKVYELRFRVVKIQYRVLYFFHGRNVVVLSHGLTKKSKVPKLDIDTAVDRRGLVNSDPEKYTATWTIP